MKLAERMDLWLESHTDESVVHIVRDLLWNDRAEWVKVSSGQFDLVSLPDDATVLIEIRGDDFGITDAFQSR